jgi:hypothetical protein
MGAIERVNALIEQGVDEDAAHDMVEAPAHLTVADIEAGYDHDDWRGWGYLGERQRAMGTATGRRLAAAADRRILAYANAQGWDRVDLFNWTNSTYGRHFGDCWLQGAPTNAMQKAVLERDSKALLRKVDA